LKLPGDGQWSSCITREPWAAQRATSVRNVGLDNGSPPKSCDNDNKCKKTIFPNFIAQLTSDDAPLIRNCAVEAMSKQFKNKKKGGKGPRPAQNGAPVFSEDALAQLTSKLDKNLSSSADHKRKNPPADNTTKQDQKRQRNTKEPSKNADSKNADMDLLAEIRALGGNEDDFDLINGIDSEDEDYIKDQKLPVDKKLKAELAAFSKELGLADHVPEDAEPEEDELEEANGVEEQGEEEEEEEEESESEEEPESESEGISKPKFGDMVSEPFFSHFSSELIMQSSSSSPVQTGM
jgi:hypothetical protein